MLRVKLTLAQAEAVAWAIAPMSDHWTTEDGADARDGDVIPGSDLPRIVPDGTRKTSKILILSPRDEVNEDLLYRLEEQLPDMARQSSGFENSDELRRSTKAALNAARRIRHRLKHRD